MDFILKWTPASHGLKAYIYGFNTIYQSKMLHPDDETIWKEETLNNQVTLSED